MPCEMVGENVRRRTGAGHSLRPAPATQDRWGSCSPERRIVNRQVILRLVTAIELPSTFPSTLTVMLSFLSVPSSAAVAFLSPLASNLRKLSVRRDDSKTAGLAVRHQGTHLRVHLRGAAAFLDYLRRAHLVDQIAVDRFRRHRQRHEHQRRKQTQCKSLHR